MRLRLALTLLGIAILAAACGPAEDETASPSATERPTPSPSSRQRVTVRPSPSASPTASGEQGGVYLALGDSVTFGIGVSQPRRNGFVGLLAERLAAADPPITETEVFAVPGETATGFLERRLDDVLAAIREHGERVELVTIGLGANELLRIRRDPACEADRAAPACSAVVADAATRATVALDGVVGGVQKALDDAGANARVLVLAYYNPDVEPIAAATIVGTDRSVACDPADDSPGLNDRIACIAEAHGVELVDLYAAFLGREDELTRIGAGDVHPNAAGHAVIADELAAVLGLPD